MNPGVLLGLFLLLRELFRAWKKHAATVDRTQSADERTSEEDEWESEADEWESETDEGASKTDEGKSEADEPTSETLARISSVQSTGPAVEARLDSPGGVAVDSSGNLYIADSGNHCIRKVDAAGSISTVAGTGEKGYTGDDEPAVKAQLDSPCGVAVDSSDNLYIADSGNYCIRKVNVAGNISTVAGTGKKGYSWGGEPAMEAQFDYPCDVAVDGSGNIYIADTEDGCIYKVDAAGIVSKLVAETGEWNYRGYEESEDWDYLEAEESAAHEWFSYPGSVAVDRSGNLYIADTENSRIRKVDTSGNIYTVAGTGKDGDSGDGGLAVKAQLSYPHGVAVDGSDNLYIADLLNHRIRKVDAAGNISTVAGTGEEGDSGDGGLAVLAQFDNPGSVAVDGAGNLYIADTGNNCIRRIDTAGHISTAAGIGPQAQFDFPESIAVDGSGNIYIADSFNQRIRKVDAAGNISTVTGTGEEGCSGDGGPAVQAQINSPEGVAVDGAGNLYIADKGNDRIRKVDAAGNISTMAGPGEGGLDGDGGPAIYARLSYPSYPGDIAADGAGNLYIADSGNHRIRKVDAAGNISTVAGTGEKGYSGDGGPAVQVRLDYPSGVAVDGTGNFYIADTKNHCIRKVDIAGNISTVAGTGEKGDNGDGGPAVQAQLDCPSIMAVDRAGNIYIADEGNHRIRKMDAAGDISTVAGTGEEGYSGDGSPAVQAQLNSPGGVAVDGSGNIYIADRGNDRIRKVDAAGVISTAAGTGEKGDSGDGGPAVLAQLSYPGGMAVDGSGNIYIADGFNHRIRKVDAAGVISTAAGTKEWGYSGDGGPAVLAQLGDPGGLTVDDSGNLYIADTDNFRIRKVDAAGIISTAAGTGEEGYSGDGGPAVLAQIAEPGGVAVDPSGNLYIADYQCVRKVDATGNIFKAAGIGEEGYSGDGYPAIYARLSNPGGLAVASSGALYIADWGNDRIRKVDVTGNISTAAGTGEKGYSGDGGPAAQAQLTNPSGLAVDRAGNLYIADSGNHCIRKIDAAGNISTVAGTGKNDYSGDGSPAVQAQLDNPKGVAVDDADNLYIADTFNHCIRKVDTAGIISTVIGTGQSGYKGDRKYFVYQDTS